MTLQKHDGDETHDEAASFAADDIKNGHFSSVLRRVEFRHWWVSLLASLIATSTIFLSLIGASTLVT